MVGQRAERHVRRRGDAPVRGAGASRLDAATSRAEACEAVVELVVAEDWATPRTMLLSYVKASVRRSSRPAKW
jgi:hypothetical protein